VRLTLIVVMLVMGAVAIASTPSLAAATCHSLWKQRKSIYAEHDYCFTAIRDKAFFSVKENCNSDIVFDDVEQSAIDEIKKQEIEMKCENEDIDFNLNGVSCSRLWVERNSLYKARNYCFRTKRAIEYFGNEANCIRNERDLKFTPEQQKRLTQVVTAERNLFCN
jgi:YARHG domain